ncbi:hypothetical protein SESBI_03842 [Sesbania bispinosa]|nr:hypothetical protein SESBI_03842 [Sesbania bispinosa]
MGRARVTLKHIQDERARKIAFMQRRKGLMKKVSDFSTMSGANACLIVYDGDSNGGPMTWPQDLTQVHSTLGKYETQKNEKPLKTFDLQDFFDNRKDMVETEISKVKKEIINVKYPTWNPNFNNLGEQEQRMFIATLDDKIEACNQRINMLKNKQQQSQEANSGFMQNMAQEIVSSSGPSQLNFIQNISQSQLQLTPAPLKAPYDNNEMVNFTNQVGVPLNSKNMAQEISSSGPSQLNFIQNISQSQLQLTPAPLKAPYDNNEMVNFTNQVGVPLNSTNMAQEIVSSSGPSQLNFMQNISQSQLQLTPAPVKAPYDNNEMVNFTNQVGVPLNSTNQLVEPIDWANPLSEPVDWANYFGDDLLGSLGWATQLDDPVLHNIPSQCHNEQQGASLFALPPPLDGHMNKKP